MNFVKKSDKINCCSITCSQRPVKNPRTYENCPFYSFDFKCLVENDRYDDFQQDEKTLKIGSRDIEIIFRRLP